MEGEGQLYFLVVEWVERGFRVVEVEALHDLYWQMSATCRYVEGVAAAAGEKHSLRQCWSAWLALEG